MSRYKQPWPFLVLLFLLATSLGQDRPIHIGEIEFFGYGKIDVAAIRSILPVSEGADLSEAEIAAAREKIRQGIIRSKNLVPTEVGIVCCDDHGAVMIYVGLPGSSYRQLRFSPAPLGSSAHLPAEIVERYQQAGDLLREAVKADPREDDSKGYALSLYGPLRSKQLEIRQWAAGHSSLLQRVLISSSDPQQREVAAEVLGYSLQSREQILALTRATRDPNEAVRNNATRALGVLARSDRRLVAMIPAAGFVAMLNSGIWVDRNKAGLLLSILSEGRDPTLIRLLRTRALASLIEMAQWRSSSHAYSSRLMLGRIAGIEEGRLIQLISAGRVGTILEAVQRLH